MCDKDNTYAFGAEIPHQLKEFLNFLLIQRRSRLIQNQNLTFHVNCARDSDHLLHREGTGPKLLRRFRGNLQGLQNFVRVSVHFFPVLYCACRTPDKHILRNSQIRAERDLLIHGTDTHVLRILRRVNRNRSLRAV